MNLSQSELYDAFYCDPVRPVGFLRWLRAEYDLARKPTVLDIGCGTGRLFRPLTEMGWKVVGMEPDSDYAEAARRSAKQLNHVSVEQGGFQDIDCQEYFDLIAAINAPFAHLLCPQDRVDAVNRSYHALKPGGILVLDMANFLWILKNYRSPERMSVEKNGNTITRTPEISIDFHSGVWTHLDTFAVKGPHGQTTCASKAHRYYMCGFPELEHILRSAGFSDIRTYNSLDSREPEKLNGARLIVSAMKPANRSIR